METIMIKDVEFNIYETEFSAAVELFVGYLENHTLEELLKLNLPEFYYSKYGKSIIWRYKDKPTNYTIIEDSKKVLNVLKGDNKITAKEYINKIGKPLNDGANKNIDLLTVAGIDMYCNNDELRTIHSGIKFDDTKNKMDLIPPETLESLGGVLTYGANKYAPNNWKLISKDRYIAALLRHLVAYEKEPKSKDESGYLHIEHVLANAAFLSYFETHKEEPDGNHWTNKIKSL